MSEKSSSNYKYLSTLEDKWDIDRGDLKLVIDMEIVSEILNHSVNTVTARHYAKPSYLPQMREALALWANHLMNIVKDN